VNSIKDNNMALNASMAEALRLTRSGNLAEATALLRSALKADSPVAPAPHGAWEAPVIDLVPERVALEPQHSGGEAPVRSRTGAEGKGRFEEQTYEGKVGTMGYRLYLPARPTAAMPLIVMLHGCTQSPEDFARGTGMNALADEFGFLVAYPRQTQTANPQKCWNWFRPADQQRDHGEPALLAGLTRQIISQHAVDAGKVYVAGLSAGGAAAAIMAAEYPDLFAAVGIHSGLACGAARDLPSALAAMKRGGGAAGAARSYRGFVPVITFHGDQDATVHEVNSREIVAAAADAAGVPLELRVEEGRSRTGTRYRRELSVDRQGVVQIEQWTIKGGGHAWSGGDRSGTYTDPRGPEASREMVRFFLERQRA
jgi:poly(hydroxyalkanoate) depolymerase family esterase